MLRNAADGPDPQPSGEVISYHRSALDRSHQPQWRFSRRASSPDQIIRKTVRSHGMEKSEQQGNSCDRGARAWGRRHVVAIAARAPLSRSTPVDATALQAPTIAVFTLIAGIGVVVLGALAVLLRSGRRRQDEPLEPEPPPPEVHWICKSSS